MAATPWKPRIDLIADGERVSAEVGNRPISQLASQTQSLKGSVERLSLTSGMLVYENAALHDEVQKSDVVYYDQETNSFKKAIAEVVHDGVNGRMICGPRAFAVGIVIEVTSPNVGVIHQFGRLNLSALSIDVAGMVEDPFNLPFSGGRYFLSAKVAGKLASGPVCPAIQIGVFSSTGDSYVNVLHKDLFEAHEHHRYPLTAKPSASQNYEQTGWTSFGLSGPTDKKRVDYFNSGASATPPAILMCVRHSANPPISADEPIRVDIYNDAAKMRVNRIGNPDIEDPQSAGDTITALPARDWPEYGEWVGIDGTNLEVAFVRSDATYAHTLAYDAAALLDSTAKVFKVLLPEDLSGWTNANSFDLLSPEGAAFKYLHIQDDDLLAAFPPLPVSSAVISLNGTPLSPGVDFTINQSGIYWNVGEFSPNDYVPWPADYSALSSWTPLPEDAKNLDLFFVKSLLGAMHPVVFSLKGIAPIKVTECPSGKDGNAGHLQVSIDLSMTISKDDPVNTEKALGTVAGVDFKESFLVSELIEGPGIRLENVTPSAKFPTRNVGRVMVSSRLAKFENDFESIALRNAKEVISSGFTYIDFLPPGTSPTGITAQAKMPSLDLDLEHFKLNVKGLFRGDTAVGGSLTDQAAIFKAIFHVLRPGFTMSAMSEANALAVQYWKIPFVAGYTATQLLSPEYPYDANNLDIFEINSGTLAERPTSLVALDGGFKSGDRVVLLLDRVAEDDNSVLDSYLGKVGIAGLRWQLN